MNAGESQNNKQGTWPHARVAMRTLRTKVLKAFALTSAVAVSVSGCGSWSPWSGPTEQSRIPRDATVYQCEGGKTLAVRFDEGGKSAMVIYPEREFRLDQSDGPRYSNGVTTLHAADDQTWLDEGEKRLYDNCKRQMK